MGVSLRTVTRFFFVLTCLVGAGLPMSAANAATVPSIAVESDHWHVDATLSGVSAFDFEVATSGAATELFEKVPARFLVDPLVYDSKSVQVRVRAHTSTVGAWSSQIAFTVARPVPSLTLAADNRHVTATLPQAVTFVFVVKSAGMADAYFANTVSAFAVDPWTYGGKSVKVSARAEGNPNYPWATGIDFVVPAPTSDVPVLEVKPDHRHVYATLPGNTNFEFVVKSDGMADQYYNNTTSPFAIDADVYGGKTVTVSARIGGAVGPAWATKVVVAVPPVKYFGVNDATNPHEAGGVDAKKIGLTLDRQGWQNPGAAGVDEQTSVAALDARVSVDAADGLAILPILYDYRQLSTIDANVWADWAARVVSRYGPGGTFWAGRADGDLAPVYFEILNEPFNQNLEKAGFVEPDAYTTFFKTVVTRARAANPAAKFLFPGATQTILDSQNKWSTESWDQLVKASPDGPAAIALADAVTVHPYNSYVEPDGWGQAVVVHNDFPGKPVWITEIGFRLGDSLDGNILTQESQAAYLQRSLADFISWPWAQAYLWFKWSDYSATDNDNRWGLVDWDGTHRISYDAYQQFIS
jgi:hypothetical protein